MDVKLVTSIDDLLIHISIRRFDLNQSWPDHIIVHALPLLLVGAVHAVGDVMLGLNVNE